MLLRRLHDGSKRYGEMRDVAQNDDGGSEPVLREMCKNRVLKSEKDF